MRKAVNAILMGGPLHGKVVAARGHYYSQYQLQQDGTLTSSRYQSDKLVMQTGEGEATSILVLRHTPKDGAPEDWRPHEAMLRDFALKHGEKVLLGNTEPGGIESGHGI